MLLPFDELDNLITSLEMPFQPELDRRKTIDALYELLVLAYVYGTENIADALGFEEKADARVAEDIIYQKVAGQDWRERVNDYFANASELNGEFVVPIGGVLVSLADALARIAETETTRVFNEAMLEAAMRAQLDESMNAENPRRAMKQWVTMGDERVRHTHSLLNGTTIPLTERFWTVNGDSARFPADFGKPEEDCNCRCYLRFLWQ